MIATLLKVAIPPVAANVVVPESTALETLKVTFCVDCAPVVTRLPSASKILATMLDAVSAFLEVAGLEKSIEFAAPWVSVTETVLATKPVELNPML